MVIWPVMPEVFICTVRNKVGIHERSAAQSQARETIRVDIGKMLGRKCGKCGFFA